MYFINYRHHVTGLKFEHNLTSFLISLVCPLNNSKQGISKPPCGRSDEYLRLPVGLQVIDPPLLIKRAQRCEIFRGRCPTIIPSLLTDTA